MNQVAAKAPIHLWIVGVVSLLWHVAGAYDYVQTQRMDQGHLQMAADLVNIEYAEMVAYLESFPLWGNAFWAIGIWGAVLGSTLLLLRSRYAFHVFAVSAVGILISGYYQMTYPIPGSGDATVPFVMMVVVVAIAAALVWYARWMTVKGVLR